MHLKALPRGDAQSLIAVFFSQLVQSQIQLSWYEPTWVFRPYHKLVVLLLTFNPVVAVILLIRTVKLKNLDGFFGKMSCIL